jgi:hypothetical protein
MLPECASIIRASPFRLLELEKLIDDMQAVLRAPSPVVFYWRLLLFLGREQTLNYLVSLSLAMQQNHRTS